jgi:hypothetical protein
MDLVNKGIDLWDYAISRNSGATHNDAMDTLSKGVNPREYAQGRRQGLDHERALEEDPNYDPWEYTKLSVKIKTGNLNLREQMQIFEQGHLRTSVNQKLANEQIVCPICGGPLHLNRASGDFTCLRCGKIVVRA